jgi:hypothetical protein
MTVPYGSLRFWAEFPATGARKSSRAQAHDLAGGSDNPIHNVQEHERSQALSIYLACAHFFASG